MRCRTASLAMAFVVGVCIAGPDMAVAGAAKNGDEELLPPGSIEDVQIAPVEQLREDPEATRVLLKVFSRLRAKKRAERSKHRRPPEEEEWPYAIDKKEFVDAFTSNDSMAAFVHIRRGF